MDKPEIWSLKNWYHWDKTAEQIHAAYVQLIAENPDKLDELMQTAIEAYDADAIKTLFEAGYNPQTVDDLQFTLLHRLARDPSHYNPIPTGKIAACVNLMLDYKVSTLKKDTNEGYCCYHYAARNADVEYVRTMRQRGVKLDMTGKNGNTALHELADRCRAEEKPEVVEKFVETANEFILAGVDIDAKNEYGWSAGTIVVDKKCAGLFKLLVTDPNVFMAIDMRAYDFIGELAAENPNAVRHEEYARFDKLSALGAACVFPDPKIVEILFAAGADANLKNDSGDTALVAMLNTNNPSYDALKENHYARVLDMFVANGWNPNNEIDSNGNTLLTAAIKKDFYSSGYNNFSAEGHIINWLMSHGADINKPNAAGVTPLMLACIGDDNDMESVQLSLLENGADVTVRDVNGKTALHYAAQNSSKSMGRTFADLLFAFGKIDTGAVDTDGKTALDYATENNNEELIKYLLTKF